MKKIFLIIFICLIYISQLQAKKMEKMSNERIQEISQCVLNFSESDKTVRKQIRALRRYHQTIEILINSQELNKLFVENETIKSLNFTQYKRNFRKIMKIFIKNNLTEKYKINSNYIRALFNEEVLQATNYEKFKKIEKKMELIEIILNPVKRENEAIVSFCIEETN